MPHVIRLRGPWEYQLLVLFQPLDDLPAGGTLHLPADWGDVLGGDFQGVVRFTRRFHRPTGLNAASRVWLVIDDVDWHATVTLNDQLCGDVICSHSTDVSSHAASQRCPARFDVTANLLPQNILSISVSSPGLSAGGAALPRPGREGLPGGLIGLVGIEIE
jgi:hypothetical protein